MCKATRAATINRGFGNHESRSESRVTNFCHFPSTGTIVSMIELLHPQGRVQPLGVDVIRGLQCVVQQAGIMDPYNRLRASMGFPIDFELGRAYTHAIQNKNHSILAFAKNFVVKIVVMLAASAQEVAYLNGFFYHDTEPLIVTSGHIMNSVTDKTIIVAKMFDGTALAKEFKMTLVKHGAHSGAVPSSYNPDIAVFRVSEMPAHPPRPTGREAQIGDIACIVGFKGRHEPQLSFADGSVSFIDMEFMTVTAYGDNGLSGSPIFDSDGFLIGMVEGGEAEGMTNKQVRAVSAKTLHHFLTWNGLPGIQ